MPGRKKLPFGVTSNTSARYHSLFPSTHTHTPTHLPLKMLTEQWNKQSSRHSSRCSLINGIMTVARRGYETSRRTEVAAKRAGRSS